MKKRIVINGTALFFFALLYITTTGQTKKPVRGIKKVDVAIDFSVLQGKIKALHGVNDGPFNYGDHTSPIAGYHKDAGFPHTRLHDVNWPNSEAVDIHAIFPLFHADADDPANYIFKKSDDYIAAIVKNGSEIIYRLGETIEHKTAYYIHPPADFEKWAKICVNIIRHYNEGWNNGFHYNIKYWEIWNEPENKNMWRGTHEQFFSLFEITAKAIKKHDASLKVGGPGAIGESGEFVEKLLGYCRDHSVPLDFFSWHMYSNNPPDMVKHAKNARRLLDQYGFAKTESHLNEWHFINGWNMFPGTDTDLERYAKVEEFFEQTVNEEGAAMAGSVLILLQDAYVDVANYYCADYYNALSMFDVFGIPRKVYYAFKGFNQLMKTPDRVQTKILTKDTTVAILAGISENKQDASVFVSNFTKDARQYNISLKNFMQAGTIDAEIYMVDKKRNLDLVERRKIAVNSIPLKLTLPANAVCLVKLSEKK